MPPKKPQVKVGKVQIQPPEPQDIGSIPGLSFTQSAATGQVRPDAMSPDGKAALGIGDVSLGEALQTMSVGAPGTQQTATPSLTSIPFSQFYAVTKGNPELAEKLSPGITRADGYKLTQPGPDGQVHVSIAPQAQQAAQQLLSNPAVRTKAQEAANRGKIDQIFAQSAVSRRQADKGGTSGQQWIDTQTLARQLGLQDESALTAQMLASIYPGIDKPNGKYPWVHADPDRPRDLVINPQWKGFAQYRDSVGRRPDTEPGAQSYDGDM